MPGLVVVEERDESRLSVFDAGDVGDKPRAQKVLNPIRYGAVGVAANTGPVSARSGSGRAGWCGRGLFAASCRLVHRPSLVERRGRGVVA